MPTLRSSQPRPYDYTILDLRLVIPLGLPYNTGNGSISLCLILIYAGLVVVCHFRLPGIDSKSKGPIKLQLSYFLLQVSHYDFLFGKMKESVLRALSPFEPSIRALSLKPPFVKIEPVQFDQLRSLRM